MAVVDNPICSLCGNSMLRLRATTEQTHKAVFACEHCDPNVWQIESKRRDKRA